MPKADTASDPISMLKPVIVSPTAISAAPKIGDQTYGYPVPECWTDDAKLKNRWDLGQIPLVGVSVVIPVLMRTYTVPSNSKPRFIPSHPYTLLVPAWPPKL